MTTAIIYDTKHGTTEKMCEMISERLKRKKEKVELYNVNMTKNLDLNKYQRIIVGGSIHVGQIQESVKTFCENNSKILMEKELGLFICCMDESREEEQLKNAYNEDLMKKAKAKRVLGGEFIFEKMNFFEKIIIRIITKTKRSKSNIKKNEINKFVEELLDI